MSEVTKKLNERRLNVWNQAMEVANRSADEGRNMSPEEQGQFDALNSELESIDKRIQSALETEKRQRDTDSAFASLEGRPVERGTVEDRGQESKVMTELRSWARGEGGRYFDIQPSTKVTKRFNGTPVNMRALTEGVYADGAYAGSGGSTVPISFYDQLVVHLIENAAIMQAGVHLLNTAGGETLLIPKTTAHSSATIMGEGSTIPTSEPTFGQASLGAYKYGALIQISRELIDDTGVDLQGYLSQQAGQALGNAFGAHAVGGTGTVQPTGVLTSSTLGKTGGTANAAATPPVVIGHFSGDNLIDLQYSVIAPYRASAACHWFMKDTTVAEVRKLKDANGQYLWQPSLQVGVPDTLLGKPVLTDPNMPAVGSGLKSVLFGDFSRYFVRLVGGIRFERSDDFAFDTDLVTFRALMRADGVLADATGAIKHFIGGTA